MVIRQLIVSWAAIFLLGSAAAAEPVPRPNIVLMMADDLGYEAIGANGGESYRTPALDALAASGVRFEHCYAQPLCTPTRVQLMTGAYNVRNYADFGAMDPSLKTFGNLLRDAGYATCVAGKWQLGRDRELPEKFGFDESCLWQHTRRPPRFANPGLEINGEEVDYHGGEYGPDLINDYALDFITRNRDRPFFLYYPMVLTHSPYQPTPDSDRWDPAAVGEKVNRRPEHFGDMVTYMDKLVGRVAERLAALGIAERTLLVFLGDNGTGRGVRSRWNGQVVAGAKAHTTTAGMRVPLVVHWPGTAAAGTVRGELVDTTDFLPTICDAAGVEVPDSMPVDGRSFLSLVRGEEAGSRDWVYSWYSPRGEPVREFVFDQRFKLYRNGEFYDVAADPLEESPSGVDGLSGEAAAAAGRFRQVLAGFEDARPGHLPRRERRPGPVTRPSPERAGTE